MNEWMWIAMLIRSAVGELIADIFGSSDEEEEFEASFAIVLNYSAVCNEFQWNIKNYITLWSDKNSVFILQLGACFLLR